MPHDPGLIRVRVATTKAGPYNNVGFVRSADYSRGREGSSTIRWFGGDETKPGNKTLEGSLPVWWDDEDADGQEALRTAYDTDTKVWLQFCWQGTDVGKKADQFEAVIDTVSPTGDSEGDAIEDSFAFTGTPSSFEVVTLAAP